MIPMLALACAKVEEEPEDLAAHACEHAAEAGLAVTAGATREDAAPIAPAEEPYAVALADGAGWLSIAVDSPMDALLFLGTADVVNGLYLDDGAEDALAVGAPNELCPDEIPEHFDLELDPGTWHLELGPSAVSEVWLLLVDGAHAHDD